MTEGPTGARHGIWIPSPSPSQSCLNTGFLFPQLWTEDLLTDMVTVETEQGDAWKCLLKRLVRAAPTVAISKRHETRPQPCSPHQQPILTTQASAALLTEPAPRPLSPRTAQPSGACASPETLQPMSYFLQVFMWKEVSCSAAFHRHLKNKTRTHTCLPILLPCLFSSGALNITKHIVLLIFSAVSLHSPAP